MMHKVEVEKGADNILRVKSCDCKTWYHDGGKCAHRLVIEHCVAKSIDVKAKCQPLPRRTKQGRKM